MGLIILASPPAWDFWFLYQLNDPNLFGAGFVNNLCVVLRAPFGFDVFLRIRHVRHRVVGNAGFRERQFRAEAQLLQIHGRLGFDKDVGCFVPYKLKLEIRQVNVQIGFSVQNVDKDSVKQPVGYPEQIPGISRVGVGLLPAVPQKYRLARVAGGGASL